MGNTPQAICSAFFLGSVLLIKENFRSLWEGTVTGLAGGKETCMRQELGERGL